MQRGISNHGEFMPSPSSKLLFLSLLVPACADVDALDDVEPSTATQALHRNVEQPVDDYTEEELAALAETPEVKATNEPFSSAPPASESLHVTMRDGTRIAVDLYFPEKFDRARDRAPVVFLDAWYTRRVEATTTAIDFYRHGGFIVAIGDARGFGASFGSQSMFLSPAAREDEREMIAWLASQPWSNGKVAAAGASISATMAEAMAASGAPALGAAILRASDFDQYAQNVFPGGVPNPRMLGMVAFITDWMRGEPCTTDLMSCAATGIAPVDGDADLTLLQSALREHAGNVDGHLLSSRAHRDDLVGTGVIDDMSAMGKIDALRAARVPARVSASWLDGATALGALTRYAMLPEVPMEVVIGATTHSGGLDADPFATEPFRVASPSAQVQYQADVSYVRRALDGESMGRRIQYYVLGADVWKQTAAWPPRGTAVHTLHLSQHALLAHPVRKSGEVSYQVDPTSSSGEHVNRWASQAGAPIYYGDRRRMTGSRLHFDSAPWRQDMELVGSPELCIKMRSDQPDGLVIAYLEDVAPDGRVTYLTEGELRLLHRKTKHGGCDPRTGTDRSFTRADAAPVTPGEWMEVELPLLPVAARLRRGHVLRLSLAGADRGTFPMLTDEPASWSVAHGRGGSQLAVPLKAWSQR
jgi:uncharacterized protein